MQKCGQIFHVAPLILLVFNDSLCESRSLLVLWKKKVPQTEEIAHWNQFLDEFCHVLYTHFHCTQLFTLYPQVCSPALKHEPASSSNLAVSGTFQRSFLIPVACSSDAPFGIEVRFVPIFFFFFKWLDDILCRISITTHGPGLPSFESFKGYSSGLGAVLLSCQFPEGKHPGPALPPTTSCPFLWPLFRFLLWGKLTSSELLFKLDLSLKDKKVKEKTRLLGRGLTNPHVLYLPPCTRRLVSVSGWVCKSLFPLSISHFSQHISLKLTGWLTCVSQLALKAWLSNWIMDFSTQHQLSYVAVCGSMSGSKLWVGTGESLYRGVCNEHFIATFLAYLGTFL